MLNQDYHPMYRGTSPVNKMITLSHSPAQRRFLYANEHKLFRKIDVAAAGRPSPGAVRLRQHHSMPIVADIWCKLYCRTDADAKKSGKLRACVRVLCALLIER
jgi:hypothetical protein